MTTLSCPNCQTPIGDTGISHTTNFGPVRQGATCPSCGAKLVRNPESFVPELRQWRKREAEELEDEPA